MDLRVERTKKNIANAYMQLLQEKPVEKITVKELSELAYINKATFYLHYKDIYDLADQLENEFVASIIKNIPSPDSLISNPRTSVAELTRALTVNENVRVLFSGTRASLLEQKIESCLRKQILKRYPEFENSLKHEMVLSMLIHGGFHAFKQHAENHNTQEIIQIMGDINECIVENFVRN